MDKVYRRWGQLLAVLNILMVALTIQQVGARYLLQSSSIAIQELEWHLFGAVFLFAGALSLRSNEQVRVDIFYAKASQRYQSWVNILGVLLFLVPMMLSLIYFGWLDVVQARSFPMDLSAYKLSSLWFESGTDSWIVKLEESVLSLLLAGEGSANPGGLPARWIPKAMIPLAAICMLIEGLFLMLRSIRSFFSKPMQAVELG